MKEATITLLNAAAEAIRPRWPHARYVLPEERDVSSRKVEYRVVWPGYGEGKREPGDLLLFRCGTRTRPEAVDHLLDSRKLAFATEECRAITKARDRMAQEIRELERPELNALTAEANALVAAGLAPADLSGEEFYPLYPIASRILSLHTPRLDTSPDALQRAFHAIISGELPFGIRVETRDFVQLATITVLESANTALQMDASLRASGEVSISWNAVVNGNPLPIAAGTFRICVERVAAVCPTPRQAFLLIKRLDAIRHMLTET